MPFLKTGTPIRQMGGGTKLLDCDIHHTKPTPAADLMVKGYRGDTPGFFMIERRNRFHRRLTYSSGST